MGPDFLVIGAGDLHLEIQVWLHFLDRELCRNGPSHDYAGLVDARPDAAHFSDAGALAVANWVMPIVLGVAPNPIATEARGTESVIERLALATRTAS